MALTQNPGCFPLSEDHCHFGIALDSSWKNKNSRIITSGFNILWSLNKIQCTLQRHPGCLHSDWYLVQITEREGERDRNS